MEDRTGRIGEEIREAKPKAPPPPAAGKQPSPEPEDSLLPSGTHHPRDGEPPEDLAKTSAA
ncbi:MAG: hypothetical protein KY464_15830 [Gemmatimonadetes bacterium]|nr:hypothetical protein [Gemmatimonadota bacterium]